LGLSDEEYVSKHSEKTAKLVDEEIRSLIHQCTETVRGLVKKHRVEIEKLSNALLERETLDLKAIVDILGERPFPPKSNFKAYLDYKKEDAKKIEGEIKPTTA